MCRHAAPDSTNSVPSLGKSCKSPKAFNIISTGYAVNMVSETCLG